MTDDRTILLVDDDTDFVDAIASLLERNGFRVLRAYDAHEGLRIAQIERLDLIIMDVIMTERTEGLYAVQAMRRLPGLQHVPIFVVSSLYTQIPEFQVAVGANWLPCDEFLAKPVRPEHLLAKIRSRLNASDADLACRHSDDR